MCKDRLKRFVWGITLKKITVFYRNRWRCYIAQKMLCTRRGGSSVTNSTKSNRTRVKNWNHLGPVIIHNNKRKGTDEIDNTKSIITGNIFTNSIRSRGIRVTWNGSDPHKNKPYLRHYQCWYPISPTSWFPLPCHHCLYFVIMSF